MQAALFSWSLHQLKYSHGEMYGFDQDIEELGILCLANFTKIIINWKINNVQCIHRDIIKHLAYSFNPTFLGPIKPPECSFLPLISFFLIIFYLLSVCIKTIIRFVEIGWFYLEQEASVSVSISMWFCFSLLTRADFAHQIWD